MDSSSLSGFYQEGLAPSPLLSSHLSLEGQIKMPLAPPQGVPVLAGFQNGLKGTAGAAWKGWWGEGGKIKDYV